MTYVTYGHMFWVITMKSICLHVTFYWGQYYVFLAKYFGILKKLKMLEFFQIYLEFTGFHLINVLQ